MKGNKLKLNTGEAILSNFHMQQFEYETLNHSNKDENISEILNVLNKCKIVEIKTKKWYRARKIKDEDENIIWNERGIPIRGYNSEQSGVAPAMYISAGRANEKEEQVLYAAEDENTALREIKIESTDYASMAYCMLDENIKMLDFTPYSNIQLEEYTSDQFHADKDKGSFIRIQRILTLPEYAEDEYVISRKLVSLIKENIKVSGMLYISHYTGKKNIAIWDEHKFTTFSEGEVVHGV